MQTFQIRVRRWLLTLLVGKATPWLLSNAEQPSRALPCSFSFWLFNVQGCPSLCRQIDGIDPRGWESAKLSCEKGLGYIMGTVCSTSAAHVP